MHALQVSSVTIEGEAVVCDAIGITDFEPLHFGLARRATEASSHTPLTRLDLRQIAGEGLRELRGWCLAECQPGPLGARSAITAPRPHHEANKKYSPEGQRQDERTRLPSFANASSPSTFQAFVGRISDENQRVVNIIQTSLLHPPYH